MKFCFSKPFTGFAIAILLSFLSINTVQAKPTIEWEPESLEIRQAEGTVKAYTLQVNFNKAATDVVARVVPALEEWISVNPVSFGDVSKGDTIELELIVSIPSGETAANHGGVMQLRGGKNQNNLAKPLHLNLTIVPETSDGLPPDPGEAGKETLLGIDSDLDGVRDDIQRYIVHTYPDQPNLQKALFQVARSYTRTFEPDLTREDAYEISQIEDQAIFCLRYFDWRAAGERLDALNAEMLNTIDRSKQYLLYDSLLGGMTFSLPDVEVEEYSQFCDFEIE
jgi:hypothetical protein